MSFHLQRAQVKADLSWGSGDVDVASTPCDPAIVVLDSRCLARGC